MHTPSAFIDAKGPAQIARDIAAALSDPRRHISAGAVAVWRHRNKIPRTAWPELQETYPDLTLADLVEMEANSGEAAHPPSHDQGAAA